MNVTVQWRLPMDLASRIQMLIARKKKEDPKKKEPEILRELLEKVVKEEIPEGA
jgi:hypothetical protein